MAIDEQQVDEQHAEHDLVRAARSASAWSGSDRSPAPETTDRPTIDRADPERAAAGARKRAAAGLEQRVERRLRLVPTRWRMPLGSLRHRAG